MLYMYQVQPSPTVWVSRQRDDQISHLRQLAANLWNKLKFRWTRSITLKNQPYKHRLMHAETENIPLATQCEALGCAYLLNKLTDGLLKTDLTTASGVVPPQETFSFMHELGLRSQTLPHNAEQGKWNIFYRAWCSSSCPVAAYCPILCAFSQLWMKPIFNFASMIPDLL